MLQSVKVFLSKANEKANKKVVAGYLSALSVMAMASSAFAAPATGNTDVDTILTSFEGGFSTSEKAFVYLAIAAVPVTLIVVIFFWIRGKFKQAVSGA